jgi:hypothetical protein
MYLVAYHYYFKGFGRIISVEKQIITQFLV